jgi:hypothetical protein
MADEKNPTLKITWPLYGGGKADPIPGDPGAALQAYAPASQELADLATRTDFVESEEEDSARARRLRETLPPGSPEWMRAARALGEALDKLVAAGKADAVEQAAIARAWAAWALGGVSEAHIHRVAHLVSRAHGALREARTSGATNIEAKCTAAAGVLHTALPTAIRARMPFERALYVVRELNKETDAWKAVVEGTAELLGWRHYARLHAASVIRAVMERGRVNVVR